MPSPRPDTQPAPDPAPPPAPRRLPFRLGARMPRIPPARLAAGAFIATALWAFFELAEDMVEGDTHAFDEALLLALRNPADRNDPLGPPWLETVMRDITALGGLTVLGFAVLAVSGLLWLQGRRRTVGPLLLAVAGGQAFSWLAKGFFDRPRPDLVPHGTLVTSASFPSGHSMMAAVIWLTLAAMAVRTEPRRWVAVYLVALAVLMAVAVGISRVYLGVHWPTDVLGGWAAGAAWALACVALAEWIDPRPPLPPAVPPGSAPPAPPERASRA